MVSSRSALARRRDTHRGSDDPGSQIVSRARRRPRLTTLRRVQNFDDRTAGGRTQPKCRRSRDRRRVLREHRISQWRRIVHAQDACVGDGCGGDIGRVHVTDIRPELFPGSNQNKPSQPTQMQDQPTQMNQGTGVPNVSSLTPFSAETNYMSLAGYLRYVSYGQTGQWLTRAEATRIVTQQKGSSP